ncbi:MAG TPA: helix-turn-helix transcriptional regulator [Ktedonobacteraceae bacterium]
MMRKKISELGRFTNPSLLILSSLAGGPKHGYAMIQDIEELSGIRLEVGTLYGALTRLEEQGWIEPLESTDRKRPYRLTALGLSVLQEQLATMQQILKISLQRLANA